MESLMKKTSVMLMVWLELEQIDRMIGVSGLESGLIIK
jgi:hypothetical protein